MELKPCFVNFCTLPRAKGRRVCVGHANQKARGQDLSLVGEQLVELNRFFSSLGSEVREVPSHPGFFARSDGRIIGRKGLLLAEFTNVYGYPRITTYTGIGRWKQVSAHRMVCEAFHGPPTRL